MAGQSAVYIFCFFLSRGHKIDLVKAKTELGLDVTKANFVAGSPQTVQKLISPHF